MFTKMMAPPVPTAESYEQAANDVTAPPTAGGLFPSMGGMGGGGGRAAPPTPTPTPEIEAPTSQEPYMESDGTTTFSTETSRNEENSGSSWFPSFGGSK
jgi:hypothetical protein